MARKLICEKRAEFDIGAGVKLFVDYSPRAHEVRVGLMEECGSDAPRIDSEPFIEAALTRHTISRLERFRDGLNEILGDVYWVQDKREDEELDNKTESED